MHIFDSFHKGSLDVQRINYGINTLLPKLSGADRIQQFRPICLLYCPYKLITEVMDRRVAKYADNLYQSYPECFCER